MSADKEPVRSTSGLGRPFPPISHPSSLPQRTDAMRNNHRSPIQLPARACSLYSLLVFGALALPAQGARAQQVPTAPTERVPVTIALTDGFPAELSDRDARAWVLRRADQYPRDVVLLNRSGAAQLSAALLTLVAARIVSGNRPTETVTIPVSSRTGGGAWRGRDAADLARLLAKLEAVDPTPLSGLGRVRQIDVWLPARMPVTLRAPTG